MYQTNNTRVELTFTIRGPLESRLLELLNAEQFMLDMKDMLEGVVRMRSSTHRSSTGRYRVGICEKMSGGIGRR